MIQGIRSDRQSAWRTLGRGSWYFTGSDQDHLHEKVMHKGAMVVWGGLTNSWEEKRSERKGEKESYTRLNADFQRIAGRDKKAFLCYQCNEIEENNRKGKTTDLFKNIRDTKGTFHAKMGTINDRNVMELKKAKGVKKRWQEYTEDLMTQITTLVWLLT